MSDTEEEVVGLEAASESGEEADESTEWVPIYPGLKARVMLITPQIAERMLAKNDPGNRKIAWTRVTGYSGDMLAKRWKLTHQAICINADDGAMIDGQHRLQAVIMAQVAARMLVVQISNVTIHDPIDRGAVRSVAYVTGLDRNIVSACTTLRMLECGFQTNAATTPGEIEEVYSHHKEVFDTLSQLMAKKAWIAGGIYGAAVWAHPLNATKVQQFVHQVATGELIQRSDPAYALREWLKHAGKNQSSWPRAMAACNALRYHLAEEPLVKMHSAQSGYRAICAKRRALDIAHTPPPDQVEAVSGGNAPMIIAPEAAK